MLISSVIVRNIQKSNTINTTCNTHDHIPMRFAYVVKPAADISVELLQKFGISSSLVVIRGDANSGNGEVARNFFEEIVAVEYKIEQMFQTDKPMVVTPIYCIRYEPVLAIGRCPMCKGNLMLEIYLLKTIIT